MTQLERARAGEITPEACSVAQGEGLSPEEVSNRLAEGRLVISVNRPKENPCKLLGVGQGLRTKVNANLGTSADRSDQEQELQKMRAAVKAGADSLMDLSTAGDLRALRRRILAECEVSLGTVPIYQAVVESVNNGRGLAGMSPELLFEAIEEQADDGVGFVTLHCGVTRSVIETLKKSDRLMGIVSRGGTLLAEWMFINDRENPLYERFDRVLDIAYKYDLVLSLGDGLRPGALADASDQAQIEELFVLGELTKAAWERGVQVIIEGPGHVPLQQIEANVVMQKRACHGAPFYVLGPLVTDLAPGYDHITGAIGGAIAAKAGADFLCYVTPGEHLRLPTVEDVRQGVIASRIAAHAADIAKGLKGAIDKDNQMARARNDLDWEKQIELSMDPERSRQYLEKSPLEKDNACSMCGDLCAIKHAKFLMEH